MDILLQFILYYSKFVPKPVRQKLFVQPDGTQRTGYAQIQTEIETQSETNIIPELENYIFSLNTKYLSDTIKDAKGFLLFVEYGEVTSFTPLVEHGIREEIGITVAHEFNIANNDVINETLIMNQAYNILIKILATMYIDQKNPEFCPVNTLIDFPAKMHPVDPQFFFDHGGWSAIFKRSNTLIF
jgi:hypothetical protein